MPTSVVEVGLRLEVVRDSPRRRARRRARARPIRGILRRGRLPVDAGEQRAVRVDPSSARTTPPSRGLTPAESFVVPSPRMTWSSSNRDAEIGGELAARRVILDVHARRHGIGVIAAHLRHRRVDTAVVGADVRRVVRAADQVVDLRAAFEQVMSRGQRVRRDAAGVLGEARGHRFAVVPGSDSTRECMFGNRRRARRATACRAARRAAGRPRTCASTPRRRTARPRSPSRSCRAGRTPASRCRTGRRAASRPETSVATPTDRSGSGSGCARTSRTAQKRLQSHGW